MTTLRGMTWRHPRGYDPMVATSAIWAEKTGVNIVWEQRSLQDFESFPVDDLARQYDLIVIDHPHVGEITAKSCLVAFDGQGHDDALNDMSQNSVGPSFPSYTWRGRQWALPIDAASQVQMWRPDLLDAPLKNWSEILPLARKGQVVFPLQAPHAILSFFSLAANLGTPCATEGPSDLISISDGSVVLDAMAEVFVELSDDLMFIDPIEASEAMAAEGSRLAVMPLGYGYVNYSLAGFRPHRLYAADIPAVGDNGPVGSAIGGTGIAVSALRENADLALQYAVWVAGRGVQEKLYATSGGQPGHAAGWNDVETNAATADFYTNTRATLEGGWLRPRHRGYMQFQHESSERLVQALRDGEHASHVIADLNRRFRASFSVDQEA